MPHARSSLHAPVPRSRLPACPGRRPGPATKSAWSEPFRAAVLGPTRIRRRRDAHGVAGRVGHHCARPLHRTYGIAGTTRATFYVYNTLAEVMALANGVRAAIGYFRT
ncbi:aminotransferase class V-fold PLP-dependent enzyme [Streptomyces coeruleorubidus]|uniref:aminotransferase class V-fold PLP-dependent enzyme n=1 Tax=Streptomyces coeruleorubidus TaxID=116188 RepID=UPI003F5403EA